MAAKAQADEVVRLAYAANPVQAHIWQDALSEAGIKSQVVGDYLDAGVGDLPGFSPEIWVHRDDLEAARKVLAHHGPQDRRQEEPWRSE